MKLRTLFTTALLLSIPMLANAGDIKPYSQATFDALAQAGKPVVINVHAAWCATCKAQQPVLQALIKQPAYKDITVLKVDFDQQKNVVKQLKVTMQSTLIVFKAGKETTRSVGESSTAAIDALFKKAVI